MNLRLRVAETDSMEGDSAKPITSAFETEITSDGELDRAASDVEMAVLSQQVEAELRSFVGESTRFLKVCDCEFMDSLAGERLAKRYKPYIGTCSFRNFYYTRRLMVSLVSKVILFFYIIDQRHCGF